MKFAIINDTHVGPIDGGFVRGVQRKLLSEAERLVKEFVEKMNNEEHPEFVVNLGDSIEDVNKREIDLQSFRKLLDMLSNLTVPVYFLIGNHDIRTLTEEDIAKMLGYERMYYAFDHGGYHFVALSFVMTGNHTKVLSDITTAIPSEQIKWLKADLAKTDRPVIIFIHYGLAEDNMQGNFWFEGEAQNALLGNRKEIRKILEESGKVRAVLSAHQHWNRKKVENGIPYFTVTSPVENFKNDNIASAAYTIVELDEKRIVVEVRGHDPAHFEFTFAR